MSTSVGIVGAGLMGAGIAQVSAAAGHEVCLRDISDDSLARVKAGIRSSYDRFIRKGAMTDEEASEALGRIRTTTSLAEAVDGAGLVIEAVFEQLAVKHEVFRELDRLCGPEVVLASNTSAIPITAIAAVTSRPESVVGTHFFSPVPMMALCELVRGRHTSDATLGIARRFAEGVGKTCVVVERDVGGFVTTRLLVVLLTEAMRLVEAGVASAEDVDTACRLGFGHTMGPLATADLTGTDIIRHAALNVYEETGETRFFPPELLTRMVQAGDLGRKTGRGFYDYGPSA